MNLTKVQYISLLSTTALLVALLVMKALGYTVPATKKGQEKELELSGILTEEIVLTQAMNGLDSSQLVWLTELNTEKEIAATVANEAEVLKLISRTWYEYRNFMVSGYYAKKAAELIQSGDAWGIAGTTYGAAFSNTNKVDEKVLAAQQAILALEEAEQLQPDTLQHTLNKGLMMLELSTVDASVMPMKGVRVLQDLDKKFPDNIMINMTLGRLSATRSGDLKKAKPRFEKVLSLAQKRRVSKNILLEVHYFLIECYKEEADKDKVVFHVDKTIELSEDNPSMLDKMKQAKKEYIKNNL